MRRIIGVFGSGNITEHDKEWKIAEEVGREIAAAGFVVLTGGLGGVMAAACRGAKEEGGITVGILPNDRRSEISPNPYVDIAIYSGMGEARNVINVKSCDAAIAIGGEYGTLSEIALAMKTGCPLILLDSWTFDRRGMLTSGCCWQVADSAKDAVLKAIEAVDLSDGQVE